MAQQLDLRLRDGTSLGDIWGIASAKRIHLTLNRGLEVSFTVPSYLVADTQSDGRPLVCSSYRSVLMELDSLGLAFNGVISHIEDEGDEDMGYSRVTAVDPSRFYWGKRPARDADGDFSDPTFFADFSTGPQIIQALLEHSEAAGGGPPEDAEGSLFLDITSGPFELGGPDLSGAPTNHPMTVQEVVNILVSTGQVDVVIVPTDNGAEMGRVEVYNGDYGTNRTGTVHLDYATGDHNVSRAKRVEDTETLVNKLWVYLGPRQDLQHWRANVTGDHPDLPRPPGGDVNPPYTGGDAPGSAGNPLGGLIEDSRNEIGVLMEIQERDNQGNESSAMPLWLYHWQTESELRVHPREVLKLTPARDNGATFPPGDFYSPGDFMPGDLITVNVGARLRKTTSGVQRVYAMTIEIDDDGVEDLGEIETSFDQEQA